MPFRPSSISIHPWIQGKFDRIVELAAKGRQPALAISKALQKAVTRITADGQWGEVIPPSSIPKVYIRTYGLSNLYCVDLPAFHKLFYTIRDRDVIVIDLVNHHEYDRLVNI